MSGNRNPTARDQFAQELYSKWQAQWNSDRPPNSKNSDAEGIFLRFFQVVYEETKVKCEKNRKKNFFFKGMFILFFLFLALFLIVIPCYAIKSSLVPVSISTLTFLDTQILLVGGILLLAIYNHISVRKYQETWTRHSRTLYQYQLAMIYYLLGSFPAEDSPSRNEEPPSPDGFSGKSMLRKAFMDQIFQIAGGNLKKFSNNMEKNEKDLMEAIPKPWKP
ncbi:MAG: hypothetical protein HFF84_03230 [Oscillibacter sp.]|nr:hypothetical protein [Oscillibacter sp.]